MAVQAVNLKQLTLKNVIFFSNCIKQLARAFNLANAYISQSGVNAKTTDFSLHIDSHKQF